ncbi:MAG: endonuclease III [Desulfobacteraceae bacterium]|nr:endonuclease III [Desulfobacteraceae bacterium]
MRRPNNQPPKNRSGRPRYQNRRFDIDEFVETIGNDYHSWKPPVVTFIANRGVTPFQVLVSTLLSLRTKDEVTAVAAESLFKKARTPSELLKLGESRIRKLIYPVGFYPTKAKRLVEISHIIIDKHNGQVPDDMETLLELPGVGRKTANLVLVEGFQQEAICVDTHVHRISNRVGYVRTTTPEKTEFALRKKLPRKYWIHYNEMLVAFGQMICRPISPFCSRCPVNDMCPAIGVDKHR